MVAGCGPINNLSMHKKDQFSEQTTLTVLNDTAYFEHQLRFNVATGLGEDFYDVLTFAVPEEILVNTPVEFHIPFDPRVVVTYSRNGALTEDYEMTGSLRVTSFTYGAYGTMDGRLSYRIDIRDHKRDRDLIYRGRRDFMHLGIVNY